MCRIKPFNIETYCKKWISIFNSYILLYIKIQLYTWKQDIFSDTRKCRESYVDHILIHGEFLNYDIIFAYELRLI